jgi:Protein of unknown function (DUF2523)
MGALLLLFSSSIAFRVFTALGIGVVSYAALSTLASSVVSSIQSNFGGMTGFTLQIVNLAGGSQVLSILCAALITRASLMAIKSFQPL